MRDRTAGSPAGTAGSIDDNICVANPRATDSSDDSDSENNLTSASKTLPRPETNDYVGKGKAPVRPIEQDVEMMDVDPSESDLDDDNVTEYSFKSEDYPHESELEDFDDEDARSHISLSDDEPEVASISTAVDWTGLIPSQRIEYERMFGSIQQQPLNGSWSFTENYQLHIDEQCLSYLGAFTPEEWVLPRHDTEYILNKLLERVRIRKDNHKVYGPQMPHNHAPRPQPGPNHHSKSTLPHSGPPVPDHQMLRSQHSMQNMGVPPNVKLGQPLRQPMAFAQPQQYPNGMPLGQPLRGPPYPMPGQMPPQALQALRTNMGPQQGAPVKIPRKLKINVADRGHRDSTLHIPPPLNAPTPPYPTRDRPDQRKTVGKAGRGKTRRQAEADEFPWNRQLDFIAARVASKSQDSWDDSVYDAEMLAEMARTRVRNEPVVAVLEEEITAKQSKSISCCP